VFKQQQVTTVMTDNNEQDISRKVTNVAGDSREWIDWKKKFIAMSTKQKCAFITYKARPAEAVEREKWDTANREFHSNLVLYTAEGAYHLVDQHSEHQNGLAAWRALNQRYEPRGSSGRTKVLKEFNDLKMEETDEPQTFFSKLEKIREQMANTGLTLLEGATAMRDIAIAALPFKYQNIVVQLERDPDYTYDELKTVTIDYFEKFILPHVPVKTTKTKGSTATSTTQLALAVEQATCDFCYKSGHQEHECRKKQRLQQQFKQENAGLQQQSKSQHYNGAQHSKNKTTTNKSDKKCFRCQRKGHVKSECRSSATRSNRRQQSSTIMATTGGQSTMIATTASDGDSSEEEITFLAFNTPTDTEDISTSTWIVDSGCTIHMTGNTLGLTSFHPKEGIVHAAGEHILRSIGTGTLPVAIQNNRGKDIQVNLKEVLIVPDLGKNLLSVNRLQDQGLDVHFGSIGNHIVARGHTFPIRHNKGKKLYEITIRRTHNKDNVSPKPGGSSPTGLYLATTEDVALTWHRRMGHRNINDLIALSKAGVDIPHLKDIKRKCNVCQLGKHTRISFSAIKDSPERVLMEQVDVDLVGPIKPPSVGGARFACLFT
jgi:hypothetical protein